MEWSEKFNIGIDVIDNQHRQILDYINALEKIRPQVRVNKLKKF